jgi:hypothetical protein
VDILAILAALESHAAASGHLERVNLYEAINQPGSGITAAIWPQNLAPATGKSGLASTSIRVEFMVRLMTPAVAQPADSIDPAMINAAAALFTAYSGDFTLGGLVREVDLLGGSGTPLSWRAGWLPMKDGGSSRVIDITVPLIVNDQFDQAP